MKRRRRTKKSSMRVIRLWAYADAARTVPYLRSLTNSLRDNWLELQSKQLAVRRLQDMAKPKRGDMIALQDIKAEADRAEASFEDALAEMMNLDVFLLDPVHGLALVPFQEGEELAWYVFDLFDEKGLTSWRYHKDPLETRRPMPNLLPESEVPLIASGTT